MQALTNGQRRALEALCRTIVPAAFENAATADLPAHVEARLTDLNPYHRRRANLALQAFDSAFLTLLILGRPVRFSSLDPASRERLLDRCSAHRNALVRLLFSSIRRLILHTHYGRWEARPARAAAYPWEGPLPNAGPVVTPVEREPVRERQIPDGAIDALAPSRPSQLRARVCIVGSGVGGAMAAAVLAEAGHDVVVLEEGGYHTAADFGEDETVALRALYADNGLRSTDEMNVSILQGRCVGGGSTVNWMVMLRTPEHVLEEWRRLGTEDMDAVRMSNAFEQFERDSHVHHVPEAAHSAVNRLILDGAAKLGWRAHGGAVNARDCMRVGKCGLGCRYDAKQGALLTYLPRALRAGAKLVFNAPVTHIARRQSGFRITANGMTIDADVVVVAAGAVGTPALLQRSGLATEGVGKNLRLHPTTGVLGIYDRPMYAATGIPLTSVCDEFSDLRDNYGHWIETPPLAAGLGAIALPGFGAAHRAYMERFEFLAPLIVLGRDGSPAGPSAGFVRLRGNHPGIRYRLGGGDRAAVLHGIESAARIHFANGAKSVLTLHGRETLLRSEADLPKIREANARFGDPTLFSAHVNGTCRIGTDPRTSGCRPDGQVHGQPGLYVMDGSLLPTAPGVNPHETIAAMTMILAQKLESGL